MAEAGLGALEEGVSADVMPGRLRERHAAQEPPWALALSNSVTEQVSKLSASVQVLHDRITDSEHAGGVLIANLQQQLDEMREELSGPSRHSQPTLTVRLLCHREPHNHSEDHSVSMQWSRMK